MVEARFVISIRHDFEMIPVAAPGQFYLKYM